jgi:hypothetical protein
MKGLLSVLLLLTAPAWADPGFEAAFGPTPASPVQVLSRAQTEAVLSLAARQHWNLFDLMDEGALWLKSQGRRVQIQGDDLRALTAVFDLGDHRIDALVPLAGLVSLSLGTPPAGGADAEVVLAQPVSGFLELGDFSLADHYGFRTIRGKELGDAFGLRVKNGLFTWDIAKIVRVPDPTGHQDPNFIAIHALGFLKPKQWQIDPVRVLPAPTPKP